MAALGALAAPPAARVQEDAAPLAVEPSGEESLADLARALGELRHGDEAARATLDRLARSLAERGGRPDVADVARYYLALSAEGLARGLEREQRFLALRERVVRPGQEGLDPGQDWAGVRDETARELLALAAAAEREEDVAPAAQAWSLLAVLWLDRYERESQAPASERAAREAEIVAALERALALFERTGQVTPRLEPQWVRARLARASGDRALARAALSELEDLARRVGRAEYRERALLGLVDLANDVGDLGEIERLLARIATFRDPSQSWPLAAAHAARLLVEDRAEVALAFLAAHEPRAASHRSDWRQLLAAAYLRTGDLAAARRELAESPTGEEARLLRAALALAEGEPEAVVDDLDRRDGTSDVEGWAPLNRARAASLAGRAWLELGRPDLAREALAAALELARSRRELEPSQGGSVVGEWLGMQTIVGLARAEVELDAPLRAAATIESEQSRRLRGERADVCAGEVCAWAARFEGGLVTWAIGADESLVVHVASDGSALGARLAVGRRSLESAARRLREAARANDRERARALGAELACELLPAAIRARWSPGTDAPRVLFLLHGPAERVPLALLWLDGRPLDECLTPSVLPGLGPDPEPDGPRFGAATRWRLLGSPLDPGQGHVLLPGAGRELAQLARRYPDAPLATGGAFVRGALQEALASGDALHCATHLVAVPEAGDERLAPVGLLLSRGETLSAAEVLAARPRSPLVVLSACATAEGRAIDGEGVHGLGRAFLEGGTSNVLVTLWPVADGDAEAFSGAFHAALARGLGPAAAARAARLELARAGRSPAAWGAFRLLGVD